MLGIAHKSLTEKPLSTAGSNVILFPSLILFSSTVPLDNTLERNRNIDNELFIELKQKQTQEGDQGTAAYSRHVVESTPVD